MEIWFLIIVTTVIAALLNNFFSLFKPESNLPPGPRSIPILGNVLWLRQSSTEIIQNLRKLRSKFGPIIALHFGSRPLIFISNGALAHQALIQQGAIFANRPDPTPVDKIINSNGHSVSSAGYGPTWRLLRRNLTSQILHLSKSKEFSTARKWALEILLSDLKQSPPGDVKVIDHFRFTMFSLLTFMCFGDKMDKSSIREVEKVVNPPLLSFSSNQILNFLPWVTRVLLRSRWNQFFKSWKKLEEVLLPYIRSRKQVPDFKKKICYVDTLLELELSEDGNVKRKLTEGELVTTCFEFLTAGTDTTSTALQWIMANLSKYPNIQAKLFEEIKSVVREAGEEVKEEDLSKLPYLKAVVLEGLRRHPPGHLVLPHTVTEVVELEGYTIPKNAVINFVVADIGLDPEVWDDPMEFRPERFMSDAEEEFDITGNREIKMMPFGAGRRICPALRLAILHLEYFVANLVWRFEWKVAEGKEVDLAEKDEFTVVMKYPFHAHLSPR